MLGITGPLVSGVRQVITDDLGRWTGFELLGRDGKFLVVLCAYQVCQKGGRLGTFTAFSQQITILRRRGIDRPNPRRQFVTDLISLLEPYVLKKADILLLGDFNESIGINTNGMTEVLTSCHLADIQAFRHGLETEESTYARGPNRVDYILASNRLLEFVLRQGCEPFNARIFSDHRGIFVDFSYRFF